MDLCIEISAFTSCCYYLRCCTPGLAFGSKFLRPCYALTHVVSRECSARGSPPRSYCMCSERERERLFLFEDLHQSFLNPCPAYSGNQFGEPVRQRGRTNVTGAEYDWREQEESFPTHRCVESYTPHKKEM